MCNIDWWVKATSIFGGITTGLGLPVAVGVLYITFRQQKKAAEAELFPVREAERREQVRDHVLEVLQDGGDRPSRLPGITGAGYGLYDASYMAAELRESPIRIIRALRELEELGLAAEQDDGSWRYRAKTL